VRAREADATHKVTLPDPWRRAVFIALGRRYGLHMHRHAGQRRQTLMVCVPPSFFSRVLWPEFEKITDLLMNRFDAITQDVLRAIAPRRRRPATPRDRWLPRRRPRRLTLRRVLGRAVARGLSLRGAQALRVGLRRELQHVAGDLLFFSCFSGVGSVASATAACEQQHVAARHRQGDRRLGR
jgi:hypothetical protein